MARNVKKTVTPETAADTVDNSTDAVENSTEGSEGTSVVTIDDVTGDDTDIPEGGAGDDMGDEPSIETDPNNAFYARVTVFASPVAGKAAEGKEPFTFFVTRTARDSFHAENEEGEQVGFPAPDALHAAGTGVKEITGDASPNWIVTGLAAFDKVPLPEGANATKEVNPALEDEKFSAEMREIADTFGEDEKTIAQADQSSKAAWLSMGSKLATLYDMLRNHSMNEGKTAQALAKQWGAWLTAMTEPGGAFYNIPRLAKTAQGEKSNVVGEAIAFAKAPEALREVSGAVTPKTYQTWVNKHTRMLAGLVCDDVARHRDATDGKGTAPAPVKKLAALTGTEALASLNFVIFGGEGDAEKDRPEGLRNKLVSVEKEADAEADAFYRSLTKNPKGIKVSREDKIRELPKAILDNYRENKAMVAIYDWIAPTLPKNEGDDEDAFTKTVFATPKIGPALDKAWSKKMEVRTALITEREQAKAAPKTAPAPSDDDVISTSRTDETGKKVPFALWEVPEQFAHLAKLWGDDTEAMAEALAEITAFLANKADADDVSDAEKAKESEDNATA